MYLNISYKFHKNDSQSCFFNKSPRFTGTTLVYPSELQLNKANTFDTEAAFLDLHLSISNDIVFTKIYD